MNKLHTVHLEFSGENGKINVSIILGIPEDITNVKSVVKSNLSWLPMVLDPDVDFEVLSVFPLQTTVRA